MRMLDEHAGSAAFRDVQPYAREAARRSRAHAAERVAQYGSFFFFFFKSICIPGEQAMDPDRTQTQTYT